MDESINDLNRTALRIYVHLLEAGRPLGVREIARGLSIPVSTTHYHLRRLEELGLVKPAREGYVVVRVMRLDGFILIGRRLVPRLVVYSLFFLGIAIGELISMALFTTASFDRILVLVISLIASLLFLKEGIELRRKLKSFSD